MGKLIIFGNKDLASLAHFYFSHDSDYTISAFSVHEKYLTETTFENKPLLAFEEIEKDFPPEDYLFFAPIYAKNMNRDREGVYLAAKNKGYKFASYISSKATIWSRDIGENCFILENNVLQPYTKVGNNVIMWSANHLGHHSVIQDHVFITGHVCFSGHCIVEPYAFVAPGVTVRDGITVGSGAFIGMGACLTENAAAWRVYTGVPAKEVPGKASIDIKL